jgi:hypothetical protein
MLFSQNVPLNPGAQEHVNSFTPLTHVAPLRHWRLFAQLSIQVEQSEPVHPGAHMHMYEVV